MGAWELEQASASKTADREPQDWETKEWISLKVQSI